MIRKQLTGVLVSASIAICMIVLLEVAFGALELNEFYGKTSVSVSAIVPAVYLSISNRLRFGEVMGVVIVCSLTVVSMEICRALVDGGSLGVAMKAGNLAWIIVCTLASGTAAAVWVEKRLGG